jgi:ATP-binding cassette subfamily F protein 3
VAERGHGARFVEEALLAPAEGIGGRGRQRPDRLVGAARRDGEARVSRKDERRAAAAARGGLRQRLRPLEKQLAAIEARLAQLSREIGEIRSALADPSLYESPDQARVAELGRAEARLAEALASAEEDWLHASARLEALRDEAS